MTPPRVRFDRAAVSAEEAAEDIKERALAAAGGADDGDEFAFLDLDVDVSQGRDVAVPGPVALIEILDAYADHTQCPDSEVRIIVRRAHLRTSESKDTSNLLN